MAVDTTIDGRGHLQRSAETLVTTTAVALISQVICQPNPNRIGFYIWNNSSNSCYINFKATALSASPIAILASFQSHIALNVVCYTGIISAIRNAGSGNIVVTEILG